MTVRARRRSWRQPSRAPWQIPPAVTVAAALFSGGAALHRPLGPPQPVQLRRQRPGAVLQVLQVAVAVERPAVDAARPAAPVAGLRGARTGVVGLRPASADAALVDPRAGRDGDLPGPARRPAPHEASPPWPGCQAPTNPPSRRARPSRSRIAVPPYSPPVGPAGTVWVRPATRRRQRLASSSRCEGLPTALLHLAEGRRRRVAKVEPLPMQRTVKPPKAVDHNGHPLRSGVPWRPSKALIARCNCPCPSSGHTVPGLAPAPPRASPPPQRCRRWHCCIWLACPVAGRSPTAAGTRGRPGRAATPQPPGAAPPSERGPSVRTRLESNPDRPPGSRLDGTGRGPACRE